MKGIITNIKRMAVHDGKGLRTTIFFKGCPLKCIWCHNPDTISFKPQVAVHQNKCADCGYCTQACSGGALGKDKSFDKEKCIRCYKCIEACPSDARVLYGEEWEAKDLAQKVMQDKDFFKNSGGGVTFSGGECLCQIDFALEMAKIFNEEGIGVDIDTCGYVPFSSFEKIFPYVDEFLYDIKAIDSEVHKRCTGKDNDLILENLKKLDDMGAKIEIRYPYVPMFNDGEVEKIGKFLCDLKNIGKIKVLAYHNLAGSKYRALGMENTLPDVKVSRCDMEKAVSILKSFGLNAINGMDED